MDIKYDGMDVLFQFYLWDQSHVTIVWNTRETGDINVWHGSQDEVSSALKKILVVSPEA